MLKRNPSLTEQVKAHLKQQIINAEFEDDRIPSETQLAEQLNVSRNTIRDALSRLEMEGIIFRRQGAGTFINKATQLVKTRLEAIVPYDTLIEEHGYTASVRLIDVTERTVDQKTAQTLSLPDETKIVSIEKLFLADDSPVIFSMTQLPADLIKKPYTPDDFKAPTFQFLPEFCRQTLAYFLTDIVPLIAPPWLVDRLDLPQPQTALLAFEEVGYNQADEAIITATSYFRDDLLRLRLLRRAQ